VYCWPLRRGTLYSSLPVFALVAAPSSVFCPLASARLWRAQQVAFHWADDRIVPGHEG
jgi:hypothetical protein